MIFLLMLPCLFFYKALGDSARSSDSVEREMTDFIEHRFTGEDTVVFVCRKYRKNTYLQTPLVGEITSLSTEIVNNDNNQALLQINVTIEGDDGITYSLLNEELSMIFEVGRWRVCDPKLEQRIWSYFVEGN
jgi:hypothetical protein